MGIKEKPIITPEWGVPLTVVCSCVGLAIYATVGYSNIMAKLDASVTTRQAQEWIDNAREQNPTVKWPRLPSKQQQSAIFPDAILSRKD
jgi:hypothetical protein